MTYLLLIAGFVLLIKGADIFVDGSSSIAKIFRVPPIIIGLTIVAFGTSAPELAVSVAAAVKGQNEIALSNVIGSNMFNLLIVVGMCALLKPLIPAKEIVFRDLPVSILCTGVVLVASLSMDLSRTEGILLLAGGVIYVGVLIYTTLKQRNPNPSKEEAEKNEDQMSIGRSAVFIIIGLAGIVFGGDIVVDSASKIAATFGLSQTLIGLTIVACGTSLPELVTSIVAARKGENELAIGNVVGSNIFNMLYVLGISLSISPFAANAFAIQDLIILLAVSVLLAGVLFAMKKLGRMHGIVMVLMYISYMVFIIVR